MIQTSEKQIDSELHCLNWLIMSPWCATFEDIGKKLSLPIPDQTVGRAQVCSLFLPNLCLAPRTWNLTLVHCAFANPLSPRANLCHTVTFWFHFQQHVYCLLALNLELQKDAPNLATNPISGNKAVCYGSLQFWSNSPPESWPTGPIVVGVCGSKSHHSRSLSKRVLTGAKLLAEPIPSCRYPLTFKLKISQLLWVSEWVVQVDSHLSSPLKISL